MRTLTTTFTDPDVTAADDLQEVAGDQFQELEWSPCPYEPMGHLFKTSCGETKCVKCGEVSWT